MRKLSHVTILDEFAVDMEVILGQGSTGCVYQGLNMRTGEKVAIKMVDLCTIDNEVALYLLNMQKTALLGVNNPYILKGLKVAQDTRYCFMITEFCNGGTLKKQIKNSPHGYLSEERAMNIFYYLLLGEKSLVEKGIVHRDLKPANIMLHNNKPKIIDFGYCQVKGFTKPLLQYNVGSPSYMAPEAFQANVYNEKTEIWALGVILYQCLTGKTMDNGKHMSQVYYEIETLGIPYPINVSYHARNIINWCLNKNPANRPTCSQLLTTYFTNKSRSKSNLTPLTVHSQISCEAQQRIKYFPLKQAKVLKQIQSPKVPLSKTDQLVAKMKNKLETKSKHYKIPDFLQASKKVKQQKQNDQRLKTHSTNYEKTSACRTTRPITRLSSRWPKNGHEIKSRDISAKKENGPNPNQEYTSLSHTRNNSKIIENNKKKLDIDALYDKICRSTKALSKNRVASNLENIAPPQKLQRTPTNPYAPPLPKQFAERTKRTNTERVKVFRA